MRTLFFAFSVVLTLAWLAWRTRLRPSKAYGSVDAIVPAYNEELCIIDTVERLLDNKYINKVIVVNDGSTCPSSDNLGQLAA